MPVKDWDTIFKDMQERDGSIDPDSVNDEEKKSTSSTKDWDLIFEGIDKQELRRQIKGGSLQKDYYERISWFKTADNAIKNSGRSFGNTFAVLAKTLDPRNWKELGIDLSYLGIGLALKGASMSAKIAFGGEDETSQPTKAMDLKSIQVADYFISEQKRKFGTEAGLKKVISEDPFDFLLTLSSVVIPTAKGVSTLGELVNSSKLIKAGKIAAKGASIIDPVNLIKTPIRYTFHTTLNFPKLKNIPKTFFEKAVKFSDTIPFEKQNKLIELALQNKTLLKISDVVKQTKQIDELNTYISSTIRNIDQSNTTKISDILKSIDDLEKNLLLKNMSNDVTTAFKAVRRDINKAAETLKKTEMTPVELQDFKISLGNRLKKFYEDRVEITKLTPFKAEAQKGIRNFVAKTIENIFPETDLINTKNLKLTKQLIEKRFPEVKKQGGISLKQLNRLEGDLIELRHAIDKTVKEARKAPFWDFQLGQKMATGAAGGYAIEKATGKQSGTLTTIGLFTGGVMGVIDSSIAIKSRLANYMHSLQAIGVNIKPNATLIRMGIYKVGDAFIIRDNSDQE